MKYKRRLPGLRLAAIAMITMAGSPKFANAETVGNGPLQLDAKIDAVQNGEQIFLRVKIKNYSGKAACIGDGSFHVMNNDIEILDSAGRHVTQNPSGYPLIEEFHSVDFAMPYNLLLPGRTFESEVELKYFPLPPGTYRYKWPLSYYVCRDLLRLERDAPPDRVAMYGINAIGDFRVFPSSH